MNEFKGKIQEEKELRMEFILQFKLEKVLVIILEMVLEKKVENN